MVMAYIIFVNPAILSFAGIPPLQGQGPSFPATQAATCLVAGGMTIPMGRPPTYPLSGAAGGVWQMEARVISRIVLAGFREAIMNAIPVALKRAIGVGIGLFILFIGLVSGGIVKPGPPGVPGTLGDLSSAPVAVAIFGLLLTLWLTARRSSGALLVGILASTMVAIAVNQMTGGRGCPLPGQRVWPASLVAWPDFSSLGAGLDFSVFVRVGIITAVVTVFSIMLSDFFDTMGTVIGIGGEAGWLTPAGRLPRLNRVLLVDSVAAMAGGAAGGSSATTHRQSAAGAGARALPRHHLHRVRGGRGRGRPHRARLGADRRVLPPRAVLRPARGGGAGAGHRAGPDRGRVPDEPGGARDPVRRPRGGLPRAPHPDRDAVHLLHHQRHRRRLHRLLLHQARARQRARGGAHDVRGRAGLRDLLRPSPDPAPHAGLRRAGAPRWLW